MVSHSFGVALLLVSATAGAAPQDPITGSESVVWIEPVALGLGALSARYERLVLPRLSVSAGADVGGNFTSWAAPAQPALGLLSGTAGAHVGMSHYLGDQAFTGVFVHGRFGVTGWMTRVATTTGTSTASTFGPSAAAMVGYSLIAGRGFAAQAAVGLRGTYQWSRMSSDAPDAAGAGSASGAFLAAGPAAALSVGWAF